MLLDVHPFDLVERAKLDLEKVAVWAQVQVFVKYLGHTLQTRYKFKCWKTDIYPLGMLCVLGAPQHLIQEAYELFPEAASDVIHLACVYAELDTIQWLYDKSPKVVSSADSTQMLPLHYACSQRDSLKLVEYLMDKFPAALNHECRDNWTPLHHAFRYASLSVIEFLLGKTNDESLLKLETVRTKSTPLHNGLLNQNIMVSKFVVEAYPEFLKQPRAHDGWLPLHCICATTACEALVGLLLKKYPKAAEHRDRLGRLPLAWACANKKLKDQQRDNVIQLLVEANPEAIDAVDNKGRRAIDHVTQCKLLKKLASDAYKNQTAKLASDAYKSHRAKRSSRKRT